MIFGNCYQGLVTSFMLNSLEAKKFSTIDEVVASSTVLIAHHETFHAKMQNNPSYQKAIHERRVISDHMNGDVWDETVFRTKIYAPFTVCDQKNLFERIYGNFYTEQFYNVKEVAYSMLVNLYSSFLNPYLSKLQHYMIITLDVGLHQAWRSFYEDDLFNSESKTKKYASNIDGEELHGGGMHLYLMNRQVEDILKFSTIFPMFAILAIGFSIALIIFLCEIFYHDFLTQLSKEYFSRKLRELSKKLRKVFRI